MAFERMTGQRRLILEAVLRADDHPTAMQVYERVAASMPNVSLTTVYRSEPADRRRQGSADHHSQRAGPV